MNGGGELSLQRPIERRTRSRNQTADALRGVAALAVCWFHFTHGTPGFLSDGWLKASGNLGWAGVEVFFVISGYAMMAAMRGHPVTLREYGRFMAARLLRLHPPYLATLLMIVALSWASMKAPGFRGPAFEFVWPRFLSHLVYLTPFFGYEWYNPVFWTLAVELQWYVIAGVAAPGLQGRSTLMRRLLFGALLLLSYAMPKSNSLVFPYLPLFAFGIAAYQRRGALISSTEFAIAAGCSAAVAVGTLGTTIAVAGLITSLILTFVELRHPALLWLGAISYSLYLVHVPIGGRVINLATRFPGMLPQQLAALALALLLSVTAAYVLFRLVDRPAHLASRQVAKQRQGRDRQ